MADEESQVLKDYEMESLTAIGFWAGGRIEVQASLHKRADGFEYALVRLVPEGAARLEGAGAEEESRREAEETRIRSLFEAGKTSEGVDAVRALMPFAKEGGRDIRRRALSEAGLCDLRRGERNPIEPAEGEPELEEEAFALRRSRSNLKYALARVAAALEFLEGTGCLAGWSASFEGKPVDLDALGEALESKGHLVDLGSFECASGTLWASDPCYDQDERLGAFLEGAEGRWRSWGTRRGFGSWGDRCASLLIVREGADPLDWLAGAGSARWEDAGECSVDSGQAGFFDKTSFSGSGGDDEAFYDGCGEKTLGALGAGVHPNGRGAASSTGDGDGGYRIEGAWTEGTLAAARILFYEPSPEEEQAWKAARAEKEEKALSQATRPGRSKSGPGL